jgi:phosphatidylglycerol:prolipoprotein diacylglycerol transferase
LIAGVGAGFILVWRNGWEAATVADLVTPALPLGECLGRIGCLLNGCCFGRVCQNVLGVCFPRIEDQGQIVGSDPFIHQLNAGLVTAAAQHSLPVYPTQAFSSLAALATFLLLVFFLEKRMKFRGQLALIYLLLYSISRFTIEIFRGDPRGTWIGGLSTSQGISVLVMVAALLLWFPLKKRGGAAADLPERV